MVEIKLIEWLQLRKWKYPKYAGFAIPCQSEDEVTIAVSDVSEKNPSWIKTILLFTRIVQELKNYS